MTDQELIDGIIRKDRIAVQFLVAQYQRQVIKTAHYFLQDMQEAEDLSQDIFIEILDSAKHFRGSARVSTWIYRITVNRSLNQVKKMNRKRIFSSISGSFRSDREEDRQITIHDTKEKPSIEQREARGILATAVGQLPDNQRIAFVLSKYDDLSYRDIAEVMNLSISSVESLLHRAKMNLQKKLVRHFPEYKR